MAVDPGTLFATHRDRLFRYFCRAVGEVETARDLTQDVFLRGSRATRLPAGDGEVRALLFEIARNLALDHHRRRVRRPAAPPIVGEGARAASQDVDSAVNEAPLALPAPDP